MRDQTAQSYRERLNRVFIHIQQHLDEELSLARLAEVACLSPFHFHRVFSAHTGETVAEHVRRLRLERAAMKITATGERVTETALAVGYETPAAFTRAFREHFGLSPTAFRDRQREARGLADAVQNEKEPVMLKPEMRECGETKVLFVRRTGPYGEAAAQAWGALCGFAYGNRLMSPDTQMIGVSHDDPSVTPGEKIRYDACITVDRHISPAGEVGEQTIAGGRYAVFLHKGPHSLLDVTYGAIFSDWLSGSGEKLRDVPCFERYLNRDPKKTKPENIRTEIWVPVE